MVGIKGYYTTVDFSKPSARAFHVLEIVKRMDNIVLLHKRQEDYILEFERLRSQRDKKMISMDGSDSWLRKSLKAIRSLRKYNVEKLYCRDSILDLFPYMASKLGFSVILEVNGKLDEEMEFQGRKLRYLNPLIRYIQRKNIQSAKKSIFISEKLRKRFNYVRSDNSEIVPNGADVNLISSFNDNKFEQFTVTYLGSLSEFKGAQRIPKIAAELPETEFVIIGEGHLGKDMKEYMENNDIQNLTFKGRIPRQEALQIVAQSHATILPYPDKLDNYFSPFKLFESMAVGTVPVSSPGGEPARVIQETECGLVAKENDISSMAGSIEELKESELRLELEENCIARIEEYYNWDRAARQVKEILNQLQD